MPRAPWYAEGLPFSCDPACGACCTRHDDYAYVYLQPEDLPRLAAALGMSLRAFRRTWTRKEGEDTILKIDGDACPFLDGTRCGVYEGRPVQCRTFPFWKENLRTRGTWESLRRFCPGIGAGERHTLVQIRTHLKERTG